jgi:hypothetical protein
MSMSGIPHSLPPSSMKIPIEDPGTKMVSGNQQYYENRENIKPLVNRKPLQAVENNNKMTMEKEPMLRGSAEVTKEVLKEQQQYYPQPVSSVRQQQQQQQAAQQQQQHYTPYSLKPQYKHFEIAEQPEPQPQPVMMTTKPLVKPSPAAFEQPAPLQINVTPAPSSSSSSAAVPMAITPPPPTISSSVMAPSVTVPSLTLTKLGTVEKIHKMLNKSSYGTDLFYATTAMNAPKSNVWVVRYIDYTSKYGLGFLFNNGSAGVYFNDSTKIVLSADGKYFQYIERRRENSLGSEHSSQKYYLDAYPTDLQKKVTLLRHFRNYLLEEEAKNPRSMNHEENAADLNALKTAFSKDYNEKNNYNPRNMMFHHSDLDDEPDLPFLKKWVKTKHAILFRISNRTVQVIFYDRR